MVSQIGTCNVSQHLRPQSWKIPSGSLKITVHHSSIQYTAMESKGGNGDTKCTNMLHAWKRTNGYPKWWFGNFEIKVTPALNMMAILLYISMLYFWGVYFLMVTGTAKGHHQVSPNEDHMCQGRSTPVLGMVIPPVIGNPYNGYINPYYQGWWPSLP